MNDATTAAILGKQLPMIAQMVVQAATADLQASLAANYPEIFGQQQQGSQQQGGQPQQGPLDQSPTQAENITRNRTSKHARFRSPTTSPEGALHH